jgi:8-oxo-dGTP diphosphatase
MNYCVGFIFNKYLDTILLVLKNRGPVNMAGKLNGIGGKIENGESPYQAMVRECKEETGLDIKKWSDFCKLLVNNGNKVYFFYTITDRIYDYKQLEDEELKLYSLYYDVEDRLNKYYQLHNRIPNLDWLIPMALNHYNKLDSALFEIKEI